MGILERNNVNVRGAGTRTLVFVHGFGCDQAMWKLVAPKFEADHRVVTYDLTGMGQSDLSAYDFDRYATLQGHAEDLLEICAALSLENVTLVGHSVGASIAALAANKRPALVDALVLVSPSPCFVNDPDSGYRGGFDYQEMEGLVDFLRENHLGWSMQMAPTVTGQPEGTDSTDTLTKSFCRTDPDIAHHFGEVTFFADQRDAMRGLGRPSLILHCRDDALVPMAVADWMQSHIPQSTLKVLDVSGHCPHMTAAADVTSAIELYLGAA